jgi:hypothetical protein
MQRVLTRSIVLAVPLFACAVAASGCKPNPSDCYDKGDEKACRALCETGKQEYEATCYEIRARAVVACVDGKGDCTEACKSWNNALISPENIKNVYIAKLGSDARVEAAKKKCGSK